MFEKIFNFLFFGLSAFVVITSMSHIGELIGYPDMKYIGISVLFGAIGMHLLNLMDKKNENV